MSALGYDKSRLLNKDSRFRKKIHNVFFLLWQQKMRQISAGIYNDLKSISKGKMPVHEFLARVSKSDENVEANRSTIFQSVRGTKQYWFHNVCLENMGHLQYSLLSTVQSTTESTLLGTSGRLMTNLLAVPYLSFAPIIQFLCPENFHKFFMILLY